MKNILINDENKVNMPIKHISPSAINKYLENPLDFFKTYILGHWNNTTGQALMVGQAFHFGVEQYYKKDCELQEKIFRNYLEKNGYNLEELNFKNYEDLEDFIIKNILKNKDELSKFIVKQTGLYKLEKIIKNNEISGLASYYEELGHFNKLEFETADLYELLILVRENNKDKIKEFLEENEQIKKIVVFEDLEKFANKFIDRGATQGPTEAKNELEILLENWSTKIYDYNTYETEMSIKNDFVNLDGEVYPVPIKGILDLLDWDGKSENIDIVDHKSIAKFEEDLEHKPDWEIAAGHYFFLVYNKFGIKPKRMIFDLTLKKKPKLIGKCLKADLVKLLEENKIEINKKYKVDDLKKIALENDLLEFEETRKRVIIDYEKRPEILELFENLYCDVINDIALKSVINDGGFLPNPNARFGGKEAWEFYKENMSFRENNHLEIKKEIKIEVAEENNKNNKKLALSEPKITETEEEYINENFEF